MTETVEQAKARYLAAAHAMQSGVAMAMNYDASQTDPKHLKVGVNSALVTASAIVHLLIAKGVITEAEYFIGLANLMEDERDSYAKIIEEHLAQFRPDDGGSDPGVTLH
jgi:hypothetical protein